MGLEEILLGLVPTLVEGAEKLFLEPKSGAAKKKWVKKQVTETLNKTVNSVIESAVKNLKEKKP